MDEGRSNPEVSQERNASEPAAETLLPTDEAILNQQNHIRYPGPQLDHSAGGPGNYAARMASMCSHS